MRDCGREIAAEMPFHVSGSAEGQFKTRNDGAEANQKGKLYIW